MDRDLLVWLALAAAYAVALVGGVVIQRADARAAAKRANQLWFLRKVAGGYGRSWRGKR